MGGATRRFSPHKVGLIGSLGGLACTLLLSFGVLAPLRIATGEPLRVTQVLPPVYTVLLAALWLSLLAASLTNSTSRPLVFARGVIAGAIVVTLLWLSGLGAARLLATASPLARYSIGGGVWASALFALVVIVASRRELSESPGQVLIVGLLPLVGLVALVTTGRLSRLGIAVEYGNVEDEMWLWVLQHLTYAGAALAVAIALGVTLGILAHRRPGLAGPVFTLASFVQTIPGLAMVGILAVPLGFLAAAAPVVKQLGIGVLGWAPVVIALTVYAVLAVVRNTYAGLRSVPQTAVEAAAGMGMTSGQILRKVELPLSVPVVFSGIRTATQQTIGNATLGVFVAAGTLGRPIFGGVSQTANDLVLLGSITLVALALAADGVMRTLQRMLTPRHLKGKR